MALKIRLRRMGRRNAPTYRIVVAESSMPRDGRIVESIGHYNPRTEPLTLAVDRHRALHWMGKGAVPTDTAKALLKRAGVFRPEAEVEAAAAMMAAQAESVAKKAAGRVKAAAARAADAVEEVAEDVIEAVTEAAEDAVEAVKARARGDKADGAEATAPAADEAPAAEAAPEAEATEEPKA